MDLPGVAGGGTLGQSEAEQERPYLAASSGKDRAYKAGGLKSRRARRESEGSVLPRKACIITRWREGTLLWSGRLAGKREGMPETAHNPSEKAQPLWGPTIGACQVARQPGVAGESCHRRSDDPLKGQTALGPWRHARRIQKIIGKPYAGKPHVRFERGFMETGRR